MFGWPSAELPFPSLTADGHSMGPPTTRNRVVERAIPSIPLNQETTHLQDRKPNMSERALAVSTVVKGVPYRAGTVPPPHVAEQITNPVLWGDAEPSDKNRGVTVVRESQQVQAPQPGEASKSADPIGDAVKGFVVGGFDLEQNDAKAIAAEITSRADTQFALDVLEAEARMQNGKARKTIESAAAKVIGG